MELYFSPRNMLYHYVNTARNNIRAFLRGETVRPKKYFYAIRPILACRWVMARNSPPPMLFAELAEAMLPAQLRPSVEQLLGMKVNGPEKLEIPPMPDISRWLDESVEAIDAAIRDIPVREDWDWEPLNRFFREELERAEG